jgi:hypothetical protein
VTVLRNLFAEGTRPTSEDIAARLGYEPFDTAPLVAELISTRAINDNPPNGCRAEAVPVLWRGNCHQCSQVQVLWRMAR